MANDLSGKSAFVTGGSRGIGKAICEHVLEKGVQVCIADINESTGENTLQELQSKYGEANVMFVKCDVTSQQEFEESLLSAKRHFGHMDILINNAGILHEGDWEATIDINLKGVVRGTLLAFKHLSDKDGKPGGTVVNTASILALSTESGLPTYTATKHAVGALTRCWGAEINVKRTGVKVCAVCPDVTDTPLFWRIKDNSVDSTRGTTVVDSLKEDILTTATIAKGFVKVLEDGVSGLLLAITREKGAHYVENTNCGLEAVSL